jgi:hypothetical protein
LFGSKSYLYIHVLLKVTNCQLLLDEKRGSKALMTGRNMHASDIQINRYWNGNP